ncbi:hypothetical protein Despr_0599 [Desulfobulbus propionicus DSM 2032]|uniref:Uncharacterized protein n=1 Tax=Desulfobulbus propionicus (strain ATCC 33891 / DSM 2032 / VKM B-1956 / 1pr3) TaxID=577650 RepID=A0A7U3YJY8_DESPD|nr:hypothetical protein Despr_0599 [Desulfobulbus propionicus DSM 2032]
MKTRNIARQISLGGMGCILKDFSGTVKRKKGPFFLNSCRFGTCFLLRLIILVMFKLSFFFKLFHFLFYFFLPLLVLLRFLRC